MKRYSIDFYKELKICPIAPVGLLSKVTSPKGTRTWHETKKGLGFYSYHLKSDLIQSCNQDTRGAVDVPDGLYHLLNICKRDGNALQWDNYLLMIQDGEIYPVAEYLACPGSDWIKVSLPIIKAYFNNEELEVIDLTPYKLVEDKRGRWGTFKK